MVHSAQDYEAAVEASQILFSNKAAETLRKIDEDTLLAVFEGVPTFEVGRQDIEEGIKLADLLVDRAAVFPSKGEMRKLAQQGGLSINKEKVSDAYAPASADMLLNGKYILIQKGKKLLPACCKIKPTDKKQTRGYALAKSLVCFMFPVSNHFKIGGKALAHHLI